MRAASPEGATSGSTTAIAQLRDDEVRRIAAAGPGEYRPEEIAAARAVLRQRGIPISVPEPPVHVRKPVRRLSARLVATIGIGFVTALVLSLAARAYTRSRQFDPKLFMVVIASVWWVIVYSERGIFRNWSTESTYRRTKVLIHVALALVLSYGALIHLS